LQILLWADTLLHVRDQQEPVPLLGSWEVRVARSAGVVVAVWHP
jgi:hypothetical protein